MKINSRKLVISFVLGVTVVLGTQYVWNTLRERVTSATVVQLDTFIASQDETLVRLADLTKQNGSDEVTKGIILDCSSDDRKRFDELLGILATTITRPETLILKDLFYKCGDYYSNTRAVMAANLSREAKVLADYVRLRTTLTEASSSLDMRVKAWEDISDSELKNATSFTKLVATQGAIIEALLLGNTALSPEVKLLTAEAGKIQGQMMVLSKQIEDYRLRASGI
jgi:hypothetical protein